MFKGEKSLNLSILRLALMCLGQSNLPTTHRLKICIKN